MHALIGQVPLGVLGPEAECAAPVGDLRQLRVLEGLARLRDDRRGDLIGVVHHPLLHPRKHARATLEAERLPPGLRRTRARGQLSHRGGVQVRNARDPRPRRRVFDGNLRVGGISISRHAIVDLGCLLLYGGHLDLPFVRS